MRSLRIVPALGRIRCDPERYDSERSLKGYEPRTQRSRSGGA